MRYRTRSHTSRSNTLAGSNRGRFLLYFGMTLPAWFVVAGCQQDPTTSVPAPPGSPTPTWDPFQPVMYPPDPEQVTVNFAFGVDIGEFADDNGLTIVSSFLDDAGQKVALFDTPDGFDVESLSGLPEVDVAEPNFAVDLIESQTLLLGFFEGEWDEATVLDQTGLESLELRTVHRLSKGAGARIAVLDTGADADHQLLANQVELIDASLGLTSWETANLIDDDEDGDTDEAFGHGTHVAGTVLTVAPKATVIPIRVLNDDGIGSLYDIMRGIDIAIQYDADIINMSFSMSDVSPMMEAAISRCVANTVLMVAAAGNHGMANPSYPAVANPVIGVAAVDADDQVQAWSGAGSTIPLAAPGVSILGPFPGGELRYATGTSMASPVIAGSIALVMDALDITPRWATGVLQENAQSVFPDIVYYGRTSPLDAITAP